MFDIKFFIEDRNISLFYSLPKHINISDNDNEINDIETLNIYPYFIDLGYINNWNNYINNSYKTIIDIDDFTRLFLSDDSINNIKLKHSYNNVSNRKYKTNYFIISKRLLQLFLNYINNDNTYEITNNIFKKEYNLLYNSNIVSSYNVNYTFPISFLSQKVQSKLHLKSKNISNNHLKSINNNKKIRLTPSHKIYDRILHDPTVDENLFTIGYLDRFTGIKEVLFTRFITLDNEKFYNTSVPFHRIRYFKYLDTIVWNRDTRLNLIDGDKFHTLEI